jgi:carboxymethylenebutenolidase
MMHRLLLALLFTTACVSTSTQPITPRLESTPRHDEWIGTGRGVRSYVVYPQRSDRAPVIVVIHENRGLTDWVRTVADRLAELGYIAITPDFLSGTAPNGGGTKDYATEDAAREGISKLQRTQVIDDLRAVVEHARTIPSANGKVSVAGFCWGGSRTWDAANAIHGLSAAYVFYGGGPQDAAGVAGIEAPVYGFYGGDDARVNATIPKTQELMDAAGKKFEPVIYEGAGHAFMRLGELPDATPANRKAHDAAWKRWRTLLARH